MSLRIHTTHFADRLSGKPCSLMVKVAAYSTMVKVLQLLIGDIE